MKADHWSELQRLFHELSTVGADRQNDAIERLRNTEPALARELAALLQADSGAAIGMTAAVASAAATLEPDRHDELIGTRFGAYRIVSHIARGGMGDVFVGERDDGAFEQRVAIKLIVTGLRSGEAMHRFAIERQILAKLDHPNIARILDGGNTAQGTAYLVMEYVEGQRIDEYCGTHRLGLRARLTLFRAVCAAIEYAHQNLVVHRDIKPSNILVTAQGTPKLLDFGIAKLLDDRGDQQVGDPTQVTSRVMTPDFASPEQLLGLPITTASDVYSLGVLLYILLSGRKPYSTLGLRPSQLEKLVCETLPARPSHAAQHAGRNAQDGAPPMQPRRLRGDLDDIVLKALRKEPERRYASVHQLSADVRRYLNGLPVEARGRTWPYVLQKFVTRNAIPVTASCVLVAVGTAAAVYHNRSITAERDRVQAEAEKSAAVAQFLTGIFELSDPDETQGATITAKEILDTGASRIEADLSDQPDTRAALNTTIGSVYASLGLFSEAREHVAAAVRVRETLDDPAGLVESLSWLGNVQYELGELEESRASYERMLAISRSLLPADHVDIAVHLNDLGHTIYAQGNYDEAVAYYEESLAMFERLGATDNENYPDTLHDLAQIKQLQGDLETAERYARIALEYGLTNYGELHSLTLTYMHDLAAILQEMDRYAEAESFFLRVLAGELELLGEDHPNRDATMTNLGRLYGDMNRYDDAERYLRDAVAHSIRTRGSGHAFTAYDSINLANLLTVRGEYDEAESLFEEALSVYGETLDADHPYFASANVGYAAQLNLAGKPAEARARSERALEICEIALPAGHWLAASAKSTLGESLMLLGDLDAAEPLLLEGYNGVAEVRPRDRITVNALRRLVSFYESRSDHGNAERYRALLAQTASRGN